MDDAARTLMADAIDQYLGEEMGSDEFDAALVDIAANTADPTVRTVGRELWCFYDDFVDHEVVASKEVWDYICRLKLVLVGKAHLQAQRRWTVRQPVAVLCVGLFVAYWLSAGSGAHLVWAILAVAAACFGLDAWRARAEGRGRGVPAAFPFASVTELLHVRRQACGFHKMPFNEHASHRTIRSPDLEMLVAICGTVAWIVCSPLLALSRCLPEASLMVRTR